VANPLTALPPAALRRRWSYKWRRFEDDVLPMFIAEMDTPLAPPVLAALTGALHRGDTGYVSSYALPEAYAAFAARHFGWAPDPGHMLLVPDVLRGISEVLRLVSSPGAGVVVNTPVYAPFLTLIPAAGRRVVASPLRRSPDGSYGYDLDALDRDLARDGVEVLLLCNPHNPTGLVSTPAELATVAELAHRHGVRVLADEIHAPLVYPGHRHTAFATVPSPAAAEAVVFVSASKAFNLPGLKAALAVAGGPAAWQLIREVPPEVPFGAGVLGVIASAAAYTAGDEWLASLVAGLDANRRLLADLLARHAPHVGYTPPQGTFLAWLDLRAGGLGDDPAEPLLERGRVALSSGPTFGPEGKGYARLNFATSPELLTEGVRRIASVTTP
jgi:cysteine-S-conjugate beta-lyase